MFLDANTVATNYFPLVTAFLLSFPDIGGHRFWDRGGVYTGVCPKKILWPPLAAGIFFSTGVSKFFFCGGVLLVDRGVILQKNGKK